MPSSSLNQLMDAENMNIELQKALIQQLEEYGDGVIGVAGKEEANKKDRKRKNANKIRSQKKRKHYIKLENQLNNQDDPVKRTKLKKQDPEKTLRDGTGVTEAITVARHQPKVIEFVEPGRRGRKIPAELATRKKADADREEKRLDTLGTEDFKEIAREVKEFGVTGFSRKEQRKYAQQKAQDLGAKAPKSQKMPYPLLKYAKKVRQQREKEQQELEKAMGVFTKKKSKTKTNSVPVGNHGHWVDRSANGLEATIGRYKKGVQHISKADLKKFKPSKK